MADATLAYLSGRLQLGLGSASRVSSFHRDQRRTAFGRFPNPLDSGRPTPNLPKRASNHRAVTPMWRGAPPSRHISSRHTAAPRRSGRRPGSPGVLPLHASRSQYSAPAVILRRKTQLRELSDREQRNCGRPTGIRIQICSLEESRLFRYTMGPLVSPARLELAYSNYGDPLRGRGRYGDLREEVFIPASRIRRQQFVPGVEADLPGLPGERHAGLQRGPVTLVVVAGETAGHQILPGRRPASRSRNHVIERQVARGQPGAEIGRAHV